MTEPIRTSSASQTAGGYLEPNLDALRARDPDLARRLERTPSPSGAIVEPARSGEPSIRVRLNDRDVFLCSAYDPRREAAKLIDAVDTSTFYSYMVRGFGLGYHVEELHRRAHARSHIFVLEHSLEVFRAAMEARDLRDLVSSDRVHLLVARDKPQITEALTPWVGPLFLGTRFVNHPASVSAFPQAYAAFADIIHDVILHGESLMSTVVSINTTSKLNVMNNIGHYCFSPGCNDLVDVLKGYPAVIVAAGPSLSRNIDRLKDVADRGVIIAMSTSLKPLLARGIVPDVVCMVDYHELSIRYFSGLEDYPRVTMLADPKAEWQTLDVHPGGKIMMRLDYIDKLLDPAGPRKTTLRLGSTVAHVAFYLAELMSADPIVFVGQDLAYPDGVTHTPGTAIHDVWSMDINRFHTMEMKEWECIVRMRKILQRVTDVHGRSIYTDHQMFAYLQQFERDFEYSKATVIDATEGGARKHGTQVMTLGEAIEKYFTRPIPGELRETVRHPKGGRLELEERPKVLAALDVRLQDARDIQSFYAQSLDILRNIEQNIDDRARAAEFQAQVDGLRREVEKRAFVNKLIVDLAQSNEFLRQRLDLRLAGEDLDPDRRRRVQIRRDIGYVTGLHDAAGRLIEFLEVGRQRLESYQPFGGGKG